MPNSPIKIKTSALFGFKKNFTRSEKLKDNSTDSSSDESPIKIKTSALFNSKKESTGPEKLKYDVHDDSSSDESPTKTKLLKKRNTIHISPDSPPTSPDSPKRHNEHSRSPSPENEALKQRKENIKKRDAFLASFLNDPEFAEAVESVGLFKENKSQTSSLKSKLSKRRKPKDETFRSGCIIPAEKRKSLRLQDKQPVFTHEDLQDESTFASYRKKRKLDSEEDFDDLEKVIYKPKNKRKSSHRVTERTYFLEVEDVTEAMLNKIARKVSEKVYSSEGTSCHQCRQKTTDTKTFCRSKDCTGVRGQFCGVCLLNRYGEDAAKALKDPKWHCPMCRGICNCSFCRSRQGKRPTGILTPMAHQSGHKSVKDFLDSLRGEGDYSDLTDDPEALVGFTDDLENAQMRDGQELHIGSSVYWGKMKETIACLEEKLKKNCNEFVEQLF